MVGIIQGTTGASFDSFVNFANLLANPAEFKEAISEVKKSITALNKTTKKYEDALKIAPTVERAMALLEKNRKDEANLTLMTRDLEERTRKLDHEIAREMSIGLKQNKIIALELIEKQEEFKEYKDNMEAELVRREKLIEGRETKHAANVTEHKVKMLEDKERNKRIADAIGGN